MTPYLINYSIPGVMTFAPLYTLIMAATLEGAQQMFDLYYPEYIFHLAAPIGFNGYYSRYFKRGTQSWWYLVTR